MRNDTWNVEALELLPPYTYTGFHTPQHSRPFLSLESSKTGPEACSYNGIVRWRAGVGEKDVLSCLQDKGAKISLLLCLVT